MEIWKDVVGFERAYQVINNKPVKCLDTDERFVSATEAARQKKCNQSNITRAILRWAYDFGGEE